MRTRYLCTIITLCIFFAIHENILFAQQPYQVSFGERPPVDLDAVSSDAMENGRLRIKFDRGSEDLIPSQASFVVDENFVKTGIERIDALNRDFSVRSFKPLFAALYETGSATSDFVERHRAWGFHLWFELQTDETIDIVDAVKQFMKLDEVIIAEPVYKKRLVADDPLTLDSGPLEYQPSGSGLRWAPNDPSYPSQWHYNNTGQHNGTAGSDIRLQGAWEIEKGNPNVIVAIIDGGIDFNHPDLAANKWSGTGFNFVNNNSTIIPHNHGTHVAGTVSAVTNNGIGVAGVAGGSGSGNGVRLMSCQVFASTSAGGFHIAPVYAADNGAAISQNSWGYSVAGVYSQAVLDAIDYFNINGGGNALDGGITFFAAGNSNASGQWYPACYSGAFAVAATNNQDKKAWYSNYDSWVDVSAPGGETNFTPARGVLSTLNGNTYGYYQGTSMACPHVSGVAALIASLAYGEISAAQVAGLLRNTTDNHYAVNPTFTGQLGTGRLNASFALSETLALVSGIANPYNFIATPLSNTQIGLAWSLNLNNDNVLIVYSPDSIFGIPQDGINYVVGQHLPGGGMVLYNGDSTGYTHEGLSPATIYYYYAFSYNQEFYYSSGRPAVASTFCNLINNLPHVENFNMAPSLPGCWEIVDNAGNGQVWKIGSFATGLQGTSGNYAYINSDAYGSGNSQNTDLISPAFDFTGYTNVRLAFKHYFRQYQSSSTARLFYSLDNGVSWTLIQSWTSTTSNPAAFSMLLPEANGQQQLRFRWNFTGTWAYYWCIDDVEVTGVSNDLFLGNLIIPSTLDTCMFATHSIVVAGGGTSFFIESGANIELVAGQSISFLDGAHIQTGSYMLAHISTNGDFCINPESFIASKSLHADVFKEKQFFSENDSFFNIYPNPGSGRFTIGIPEPEDSALTLIEVFGLMGKNIARFEPNEFPYVFDLSAFPDGVYVVRVSNGSKSGVEKVIKSR